MIASSWLSAALLDRTWAAHHRHALAALAAAADSSGAISSTFASVARYAGIRPAAVSKVVTRLEWQHQVRFIHADFRPRATMRDRSDFRAPFTLILVFPKKHAAFATCAIAATIARRNAANMAPQLEVQL
jgi:hypothetical protein